ncbi:MAG: hypothetical protein H6Q26_416 [Bacteroidetes bacterium]|nr:hypothetical protein [Bacteroidota bacterium]
MNCGYFVGIGFYGLRLSSQEIYQFEFLTECKINQLKAQGFTAVSVDDLFYIYRKKICCRGSEQPVIITLRYPKIPLWH